MHAPRTSARSRPTFRSDGSAAGVTTFLLVRHASCDPTGKSLAGRRPGVSLNDEGRAQAGALAAWLAPVPLAAVYSSPLERARETAAYLAEPRGLAVRTSNAFVELDFGDWTGRTIDELTPSAHWQRFNAFRSVTRPPGGELMAEAQLRAVTELRALATPHGEATVAVVSHADVLRGVVGFFAGAPLDLFLRLVIDPASVSTVVLHDWGAELRGLNASPRPRGG